MKILVTGAKGFIGKNLVAEFKNIKLGKTKHKLLNSDITIFEFDKDSKPSLLDSYCEQADFVFHLAGVNRPKQEIEFMEGNFGFTNQLLENLKKYNNNCPIMISSSIQASLENPYGVSKKAGEDLLLNYGNETGAQVFVYRFPNVFGKWCRPNYNSAIATFCNNIAKGLPILVNDPNVQMTLVYIDDVVKELINCLVNQANKFGDFYKVYTEHIIKLGEIIKLIESFKESRKTLQIPNLSNNFTKKLYSTYLSYLPQNQFSYPLKMNIDERGSFTEFIKSPDRGQVSINISKPGITKGNHWHHTKNEKFLVVSGNGVIRFRKVNEPTNVIEYFVTGNKLEVIDIPVGYTHNIENLGDNEMVTVMWVNEIFDPNNPDTYYDVV
jgi:UDP-2-acetamido-2,6-beta-L-arabino-hexul-4-ose reductase